MRVVEVSSAQNEESQRKQTESNAIAEAQVAWLRQLAQIVLKSWEPASSQRNNDKSCQNNVFDGK